MEARPEGAGPSSGLLLPPEWALPAAEEPPTAGPPQHLRVRMRVTHHQGQAQAGRGPCGQGRESLCWSRPPRHRGSCSAGGPVSASAGASAVGLFESARLSYLSVTPVLQRGALRPRGPDTSPGRPGGGGGGWLCWSSPPTPHATRCSLLCPGVSAPHGPRVQSTALPTHSCVVPRAEHTGSDGPIPGDLGPGLLLSPGMLLPPDAGSPSGLDKPPCPSSPLAMGLRKGGASLGSPECGGNHQTTGSSDPVTVQHRVQPLSPTHLPTTAWGQVQPGLGHGSAAHAIQSKLCLQSAPAPAQAAAVLSGLPASLLPLQTGLPHGACTWAPIPAPGLASCAASGKLLSLSGPQLHHLHSWGATSQGHLSGD